MDNAITVTQVNNYIKNIFDAEYMLQNIFVYGEIGTYKITNGIAYFNLKDENSIISCVLFGANNFPTFEVGEQVVVRGSVSYYVKGGKLSFNAVSIERFGVGLLYQKFLELKAELEALGYFDASSKKPIPARVKRIGVVTSETGAVIRDIIDVTNRRNDSIDIVLYPVKVQGVGAEKEIASGINFFSTYDKVDVIIVARGGGSMEDLQPYNSRLVADAVYACSKPVVSAVGHETDYTIIDFVSDLRAPTPSAAAELVANNKSDDLFMLRGYIDTLSRKILGIINHYINEFKYINSKIINNIEVSIKSGVNKFSKLLGDLERSMLEHINNKIVYLQDINVKVQSNDRMKLLNKGFTRLFSNGKIIKTISDIATGCEVKFDLIDGNIDAEVKQITKTRV